MKLMYVLGLLVLTLSACAHQSIPIDLLYQSGYCATRQAGLYWVENQGDYQHITDSTLKLSLSNNVEPKPSLNFKKDNIILVSMGQKPTAGYDISLKARKAPLQENSIVLPVEFITPGSDIVAQVVTSPCLILAVEKGPYSEIKAQDYVLKIQ